MIRSFILFCGWIAVALSSCHPASLPEDELQLYIANPDNGLCKEYHLEDLAITVSFLPAELLGLTADDTSQNAVKRTTPLPSSQYFMLSLSRNGHEVLDPAHGFAAFSSLLQTLAFRPQEYLKLTTSSGDTLSPSNSDLERTYGMGSSTRLLFAFPLESRSQDITIHLAEFGLHTGRLHFDFKREDLTAIPILKFTETKEVTPIP